MSIKCMTRVWENSSAKGSALLLLLAIADHAHDDGYAWPGIAHLAKKTRLSKGSVIRLTKELESCGDLFVIHSRRKGNKYIVRTGLTDEEIEASKQANLPVSTKLISTKLVLQKSQVDTSEVPHVVLQPSININEPSHVASDAPVSVGEDLATQEWIEDLENQTPPPRNPPRSAEEMREQLLETEQRMLMRQAEEPCLAWGAESEEMQQQIQRFGNDAYPVLRLGYELDKALGLRPVWSDRKKIKTWTSGLSACLAEANGDWEMVVEAARAMRENKLSIKNPYSIEGMVADAAAKRRKSQQGPKIIELRS